MWYFPMKWEIPLMGQVHTHTKNLYKPILIFIEKMRSLNRFARGKLPQKTKERKTLYIQQNMIYTPKQGIG